MKTFKMGIGSITILEVVDMLCSYFSNRVLPIFLLADRCPERLR